MLLSLISENIAQVNESPVEQVDEKDANEGDREDEDEDLPDAVEQCWSVELLTIHLFIGSIVSNHRSCVSTRVLRSPTYASMVFVYVSAALHSLILHDVDSLPLSNIGLRSSYASAPLSIFGRGTRLLQPVKQPLPSTVEAPGAGDWRPVCFVSTSDFIFSVPSSAGAS